MTPGSWLAIASVIALVAPSPGRNRRLLRLAGAGRLAVREPARRRWPVLRAELVRRLAPRRGEKQARAELAAAVAALTAELEAGGRPDAALRAAGEVAPALRAVFSDAAAESGAGGAAGDLLRAEAATRGLGCAWALAERTGAPLAGVLRRVAADLAAEAAHQRAVEVALAGPRASAVVVAGLPVLGVVLGAAMDADPLHFLLGTPTGGAVAAVGVLLDGVGVLWILAILRRASRS